MLDEDKTRPAEPDQDINPSTGSEKDRNRDEATESSDEPASAAETD